MRPTTHCQACQTPISVGEPTCWACGVVQARPTPPPRLAVARTIDTYHRSCPRCQHAVAVYQRQCKNCGYQAAIQPTNTLPPLLPSGWEATALSDGSTQLKRTTWNRINNSGQFLGYLVMIGAMLIVLLTPGRHLASEQWASYVPVVIVGLLATLYVVWMVLGKEHWRVAPGLLEVHKECLGRKWGSRITHGELLFRTEWRYRQRVRQQIWVLCAQTAGKQTELAQSNVGGAFELQALGSYLSAHTGWPLQHPLEEPSPLGWWRRF